MDCKHDEESQPTSLWEEPTFDADATKEGLHDSNEISPNIETPTPQSCTPASLTGWKLVLVTTSLCLAVFCMALVRFLCSWNLFGPSTQDSITLTCTLFRTTPSLQPRFLESQMSSVPWTI